MSCRQREAIVAKFRGRHFGFLGLLCASWVAARIGFLWFETSPTIPVLQATPQVALVSGQTRIAAGPAVCCRQPETRRDPVFSGRKANLLLGTNRQMPATDGAMAKPSAALPTSPSPRNKAIVLSQPVQPLLPERRAQFYAYSFWRGGGQAGALNGGTQYGGSQSGFVASYALDREERLALLLRGAIAHDNLREREIAVGVRWRPSPRIPFSLNVERRFRNKRSDALAAYVAGGVSEVRLPMHIRLEAFGQAGIVSGKNAGPFFDFLARADRKVVELGHAKLSAGAGAWGGGQDNVHRVDIGPSVRSDIALGEANFRLSADWRFRVAGNASPANGPAITLSTSF